MITESRAKLISSFIKRLRLDKTHRGKTAEFKRRMAKANEISTSFGYVSLDELFKKGTEDQIDKVEFAYIYS